MKIIILSLLLLCCSCVPEAWNIPSIKTVKLEFKDDISNLDKVEITINDIDCVIEKPCSKQTFILDKNNISNGLSVIPGKKNIIIKEIKDGVVINETNVTIDAILDQPFNLSIPKAGATPTSIPTQPTPSIIPESPQPTVTPIQTPVSSITPSASPLPTPTATNSASSGGSSSGGGSGSTQNSMPDIQVSASVAPDEIGAN